MKQFIQFNPSITLGNHQWKGATPLFNKSGITIKNDDSELANIGMLSKIVFMITRNSNIDEASAWIRKYFSEASLVNIFFVVDIRGIKDSKLISKPVHTPNHELDEIEMRVPPTRVSSRRIFVELLGIREESSYSIYGV